MTTQSQTGTEEGLDSAQELTTSQAATDGEVTVDEGVVIPETPPPTQRDFEKYKANVDRVLAEKERTANDLQRLLVSQQQAIEELRQKQQETDSKFLTPEEAKEQELRLREERLRAHEARLHQESTVREAQEYASTLIREAGLDPANLPPDFDTAQDAKSIEEWKRRIAVSALKVTQSKVKAVEQEVAVRRNNASAKPTVPKIERPTGAIQASTVEKLKNLSSAQIDAIAREARRRGKGALTIEDALSQVR